MKSLWLLLSVFCAVVFYMFWFIFIPYLGTLIPEFVIKFIFVYMWGIPISIFTVLGFACGIAQAMNSNKKR